MKHMKYMLVLLIPVVVYCQYSDQQTATNIINQVRAQYGAKYENEYQFFSDSLFGTKTWDGYDKFTYTPLLHNCVIFCVTINDDEGAELDSSVFGIYKDGTILWMTEPIIYGFMMDITAIDDINNDGKIEIVTRWPKALRGEVLNMGSVWVFSWNGSQGEILNEVGEETLIIGNKQTKVSKIDIALNTLEILDLDDDDVLELRGVKVLGSYYAEKESVEVKVAKWNGTQYAISNEAQFKTKRNFLRADKMSLHVTSTITQADNKFLYNYTINSDSTSKQNIEVIYFRHLGTFDLQDLSDTTLGYEFGKWQLTDTSVIQWYYDILKSKKQIKSGEIRSGFNFSSNNLPAIADYYIQGDVTPPSVVNDETAISDEETNYDIWNNSVHGKVIVPKYLSSPFIPLDFIDTLSSYTTQSRTLGWVKDEATASKYLNYFASAKTLLQANNVDSVKSILKTVVSNTISDSTANISSEAYALLRFNAEYLQQYPQNLTGSFTAPKTAILSWSAVSGASGYNVYRAVYYDGAALSYTKLNSSLLTSTSYTDTSAIDSSIPSGKNVYVRYYVTAGDNAGGNSLPSNEVSLFAGKTLSGTIAVNTTVSDSRILVNGSVIVNSGSTLTITSGSSLSFFNGISITVNGTLSAGSTMTIPSGVALLFNAGASNHTSLTVNGTLTIAGTSSSPVTGSNTTIVINGSNAAGSSIGYLSMPNGGNIQMNSTSNITLDHLTISNYYGTLQVINSSTVTVQYSSLINTCITYSGSSGSIMNNSVAMDGYNGIIIQNGSSVNTYTNTVWDRNEVGGETGITYYNGSNGSVAQNDIAYYDYGMKILNNSSPHFHNPYVGTKNNRISNCWCFGMQIDYYSYPVIGYNAIDCFGANSIYNNGVDIELNGSNSNTSSVNALGTYWNNGSASNAHFSIGTGSSIDNGLALSTNPWASIALPSLQIASLKISSLKAKMSVLSDSVAITGKSVAVSSEKDPDWFVTGIQLQNQGKLLQAANHFITYLGKYPNYQRTYVELYNCYNDETAGTIIQYFKSLPSAAAKEHQFLLSYLYLKQGDKESAKGVNNAVIAQYPNTTLALHAKLNNFYIALYCEHDTAAASSLLNEVAAQNNSMLKFDISLAQNALKYYIDPLR